MVDRMPITEEEAESINKAAVAFDGHVTNGSSIAVREVVEKLILKYVREWTR